MNALPPLVHLVDDDPSVRSSLSRLFLASGYETSQYASAAEFLGRPADTRGGCVVLDLHLPGGLSGLELQEQLASHPDSLPIVFLTGHGDVPSTVRAMKRGAVDFLTKPVPMADLLAAVTRALNADQQSRRRRADLEDLRARRQRLTPREGEVFELVVAGMLNKQIARTLGTTERTIKAHRAQVMKKFDADSLAQLVRIAAQLKDAP
jgi:FixJ family two-component response regulator